MSARKDKKHHVVAIKNYTNTIIAIKDDSMYLPFEKEVYIDMIENDSFKIDSTKDLKKFINASKVKKADVLHSWESFLVQGYTLVNINYSPESPSLERICFNDTIKYVGAINAK